MADMTGRVEKRFDEPLRALFGVLRRQKVCAFRRASECADCVEVDAAKELFVARRRHRLDVLFSKLCSIRRSISRDAACLSTTASGPDEPLAWASTPTKRQTHGSKAKIASERR